MFPYDAKRKNVLESYSKLWRELKRQYKNAIPEEVAYQHEKKKYAELKILFQEMNWKTTDKFLCLASTDKEAFPVGIKRDFLQTHCCGCGRSFPTPTDLKIHNQIHSGSKICPVCLQFESTPGLFKWGMHEIKLHGNFADELTPLPTPPPPPDSTDSDDSLEEESFAIGSGGGSGASGASSSGGPPVV